jgi:hypothetical protein
MAFHLTVTGGTNAVDADIVLTDSDTLDMTGSAAASELQSQIRAAGPATLTVTWSNYQFVIDAIDSTSIEVSEPSDSTNYSDATEYIFGGTPSGTTSLTGGFPRGCTVECDLQSDVVSIQEVYWDTYPLQPAPEQYFVDPTISGSPSYYHVKGKKLRLYPTPREQKRLVVRYKGIPSVSAVGSLTGASSVPTVPVEYHMALVYKVASQLAAMNFEARMADRYEFMYQREVSKYLVRYGNRVTETKTDIMTPLWYRVET